MYLADWAFNACLASTSVASSTVLVTTSNVFVFFLAVCAGDETFQLIKLAGAVLAVLGTALTAFHDFAHYDEDDYNDQACDNLEECDHVLKGDLLAVVAAALYAVYAVQVRVLCPRDEKLYSMQLLLGYIGLLCAVPLFPFAAYQFAEVGVSFAAFSLSFLKGFLDFVVTDYLMFRAVILTNATVATVGLGLSIPLAFLADFIFGKEDVISIYSLLGAFTVAAGFLIVNLVDDGSEDDDEEEEPKGEPPQMIHMVDVPAIRNDDSVLI
jgi:solute carrier family 35 protein F5